MLTKSRVTSVYESHGQGGVMIYFVISNSPELKVFIANLQKAIVEEECSGVKFILR